MAWNERLNLPARPCAWCQLPFKPLTDSARYCKPDCRSASSNEKLAKRRRAERDAARKES